MCYGNLRGIREAGKAFALPTYLFTGSVLLMIAVGLVREVSGGISIRRTCTTSTAPTPSAHGTAGLTSMC